MSFRRPLPRRFHSRVIALATVAAAVAAAPKASATNFFFAGFSGSKYWSQYNNWDGAMPPEPGDIANNRIYFRPADANAYTVYNIASIMDYGLMRVHTLQSDWSTVTMTGGRIEVGSLVAATTFGNSFSNAISFNNTVTFNITGSLICSGDMTGGGYLEKIGGGTLTLSGNNSLSGGLEITGGSVKLGSSSAISGGVNTIFRGGGIDLNGNNASFSDMSFGDTTLVNTGGLTGTGTISVSGSIYYAARTDGQTNALTIANNINLSSGTHYIGSNGAKSKVPAYDILLSGAIQGAGGLAFYTANTVTALTGSSSYGGTTDVQTGTVLLGKTNALSSSSPLNVNGTLSLAPTLAGAGLVVGNYSQLVPSLSGAGAIRLGSATLTVQGPTSTTFSGVISGTGSLVKDGASTLSLTGANTYTGGTTIKGGRLVVTNPIGSYADNGLLEINIPNTVPTGGMAISNGISGTGGLIKSGNGVLLIYNNNSYSGGTTINDGVLVSGNTNALGSIGNSLDVGTNGTLYLGDYDLEIRALSGSGKIGLNSGRLLFTTATTDSEFSGVISGQGGLSKPGTGTLTLSGKNTYTGGTVINGGKLIVTDPTGNYTDNATLEVKRDDVNNPGTLTGNVTGSGNFIKSGAGTLTASGNLQNAGTVTISGGILAVPKLARNYINNAGLSVYGSLSNQIGIISGTGYLRKDGTDTLTLGSGNTYSGGTSIYGGKVVTSSNTSLGAAAPIYFDVASATLVSTGYDVTATTLTGPGTISINGAKLTIGDSSNFEFKGSILGNASTTLTKKGTGTATLSGTGSTYSGLTSVDAGRLVVPKPAGDYALTGALEFALASDQSINKQVTGTGSVTVSGTGTLTTLTQLSHTGGTTINSGAGLIAYTPSGDYVNNGRMEVHNDLQVNYSGAISGSGPLTKTGDATFFVTGNNSFTGGTTVSTGTFAAASTGSLANGNVTVLRGSLVPVVENVGIKDLTLGDGSVTSVGGLYGFASFALNGGITYNFASGANPMTIASRLNLSSGLHTFTDNGNHSNQVYDAVISAGISGSGGINKDGSHSLILTAANSYTGGTKVSNGTLYLGADGALPAAGALTVNAGATASLSPILWNSGVSGGEFSQTVGSLAGGGSIQLGSASLTVNNGANATWDGIISGTGSLIKKGGANLLLTGANSYSGGTVIEAGKLIVRQPNGPSYDNRARLEFNAAQSVSTSYAGTVFGSGGVDKAGSGTVTLTGINSYLGGTNVIGGRLIVANPNGNYSITTSNNLEFSNALDTTASGVISGAGNFTKSGAGTTTLLGTNTLTGTIRSSGGTLTAGSAGAFAGTNVILSGGNLGVNVANVAVNGITFGEAASTNIGNISGAGSLALQGGLAFNFMTNTRTSPVLVGSSIILGSGTHNLADNGQRSSGAYDAVFSGAISGTGALTKTGTGIFAMTGSNSYTGATTLNGGTLYAAATNTLSAGSAFDLEGGTLSLNPTVAGSGVTAGSYSQKIGALTGSGSILLGSATLTTENAADALFYGSISGTGGLVKTGAGTLFLINPKSYTGGTTISAGKLVTDDPIGNYLDNGILESAAETFTGVISGTGSFIKVASNETTLTGLNTYSGGTTIMDGKLTVSNPVGNYANSGILQFSNGTATGVISGTGSLVKAGSGTVTLSGVNTYTGGTTIQQGRLIVTNPVGNYANSGVLEVQNAGGLTFDGRTVTGSGSFAKSGAGTLTLSQKPASAGGIEIKEGTLKGTASVFAGKSIVGDAGATLQLDTTGTTFFSTDYSGAGNLLKSGTGRLILDGPLANTGSTTVAEGAIYAVSAAQMNALTVNAGARFINDAQDTVEFSKPVVNQGEFSTTDGSKTTFDAKVSGAGGFSGFGTVEFNGGYSPGNSPASVTLQGDMILGSSNDLTMELGGTTLGTSYDHLTVNGLASLNGALNVAWYGNFTASLGQSFDLFDFPHSTGSFTTITLPTLSNGLRWNSSTLYTDGKLSVQAVPEPTSMAALGLGALALLRRRKK